MARPEFYGRTVSARRMTLSIIYREGEGSPHFFVYIFGRYCGKGISNRDQRQRLVYTARYDSRKDRVVSYVDAAC
mgnify:CR=1 FL=1